jgi:hypothetical protein
MDAALPTDGKNPSMQTSVHTDAKINKIIFLFFIFFAFAWTRLPSAQTG